MLDVFRVFWFFRTDLFLRVTDLVTRKLLQQDSRSLAQFHPLTRLRNNIYSGTCSYIAIDGNTLVLPQLSLHGDVKDALIILSLL